MTVFIAGRIEAIKQDKKSAPQLRFISTDPDGGKRFDVLHLSENTDVSKYYIGQEVNIAATPFWNKKLGQVEFALLNETIDRLSLPPALPKVA